MALAAMLSAPSTSRPTHEQMLNIAANFCNIYCEDGVTPMFTAFLPKAEEQGRTQAWLRLLVAAGSTHVTFSPKAEYHNYMGGGFDWLNQPERFSALVKKVCDTTGANGLSLTPVLFLDEGGPDPKPRINTWWQPIAIALRRTGVIDRCIIVPAWEPVKGDWTSEELSYSLQCIKAWFTESLIGCHFSPGRWVGSSNPIEPDDPWQGAESDFYKTHGGEFIDVALYQAPADCVFTPNCDPNNDDCWLNRWLDGVIRLGRGFHGWRVMPFCLSEGAAYSFIRYQSTPQMARVWATAGRDAAKAEGVTCSYMNGLPL